MGKGQNQYISFSSVSFLHLYEFLRRSILLLFSITWLDVSGRLEDDSEDNKAVEADAGGADVHEALDVPDQGQGEGHEQSQGCQDDHPQVGVVLQLGEVWDNWGAKIPHDNKKCNSCPHQVANDPQFYQQLASCTKCMKCKILKISPPR